MRIGIITLPLHTNYGGVLQAYALQTVLERMGHKVVIIKKERRKFSRVKDWIKMTLFILFPIMNKYPHLRALYRSKEIRSFINSHFSFWGQKDIKNKKFDVLLAGSDQIWRKWGESWDIFYYFLSFARDWNIRRYSYAASLGIDYWDFSEEETIEIGNLLEKFEKISVRESDAKRILFEKFNICSEVYLDPTMLLTKSDYISEFGLNNEKVIKFSSYILDMDEEKSKIVSALSSFLNCSVHIIGDAIIDKKNREVLPSVENWISDFAMSGTIITDSFHGTAFSIIFNKNFVVLSNDFRGQSRLKSILKLLNLESRLATNIEDALKVIQSPIDWDSVNSKLGEMRMKSMCYLMKM